MNLKQVIAATGLMVAAALTPPLLRAQDDTTAPSPPAETEDAQSPVMALIAAINDDDNGIKINHEARTIDLEAVVCLRECDFLEQLACTETTREHESILKMQAQPSAVHTAMLLMGLEPGAPMSWAEEDDSVRIIPPSGPRVQISLIQGEGDEQTQTPANEWIIDQNSGETMQGDTWLFTGSLFTEMNGREIYVADAYGTAISLVNFGDDLLARPTDMTHSNDSHNRVWGTKTDAIPEVGTAVIIRLTLPDPASSEDAQASEEAPEQAPGEDQNPEIAPDEAPDETPDEAPSEAPDETPPAPSD